MVVDQRTPMRGIGISVLLLLFFLAGSASAQTVSGIVTDTEGEPLTGVNVAVQNTFLGTTTDTQGQFVLRVPFDGEPRTLVFSFVGFQTVTREISEPVTALQIEMPLGVFKADEVVVSASRVDERALETPVTVERISAARLQQSPVTELVSSLESFKGVDVSRSSFLISSLSTRGFNSAKSERLIQLVDYVDYVSPSLSIYTGNIAGPPEIDIEAVEVIHGANSALYGANAFNGVVLMQTRDPFIDQGLELDLRGGSRQMFDVSGRFAERIGSRFAFKLVGRYLEADEFISRNYAAQPTSVLPTNNPADDPRGSDVINRYGEASVLNPNTVIAPNTTLGDLGLEGQVFTPGFTEAGLVTGDFRARAIHVSPSVSALLTDDIKATYTFRYALGNGIYQSSNRYAFDDINSNIHSLELLGPQWTFRAYRNDDGAGDTYDLNFLGSFMNLRPYQAGDQTTPTQSAVAQGFSNDTNYAEAYAQIWAAAFVQARQTGASVSDAYQAGADAAQYVLPQTSENRFDAARDTTLGLPSSGLSPTFQSDSQLYHAEGQYDFTLPADVNLSIGASYRVFRLTSNGTLFSDGQNASPIQPDGSRDVRDGINNYEAGTFVRLQRGFANDRLKLSGVARLDAFKNFDARVSPRISGVYSIDEARNHNLRASFAQAYRAPAQLDQYIYLDIGPILLLGNVGDGYRGLDPFSETSIPDQLAGNQLQIDPLTLEKMNSFEFGYKGVIAERLFADLNYYYSRYTDFIGTRRFIGKEDGSQVAPEDLPQSLGGPASDTDPLRARLMQVWLNSDEEVATQGFQIGLEYRIAEALTLSGNYTWSDISDDGASLREEINLGFNTPEHKFNVGVRGEPIDNLTYSANLRWNDSYLYEMPFSEGTIESFSTIDAQIGYTIQRLNSTVRIGGTNLADADAVSAFGAASMGRILYAGVSVKY